MASTDSDRLPPRRTRFGRPGRMVRVIVSPFYRYRHARLFHSLRVGLAMLVSILATTGINIPHGIWASVTLLVVIGGLQHHGNIRKKAAERALGTMLGATIGLVMILQRDLIGSLPLTYLLMSVVAAICAWFAIGKPGYIALLTAITMCIVAGHGDNLIDTGLWRTLNVMIGIVLALAFSFALPLHATYSWRYLLADNLRAYARVYARMLSGKPFSADEQWKVFMVLSARLVQLRSLIPSVAREIGVPQAQLEEIQRLHRALLSAIELMGTGALVHLDAAGREAFARQCGIEVHTVRVTLLAIARALRFAGATRFRIPDASALKEPDPALAASLPADLQGPYWLGLRIAEQVDRLRALLLETESHWNIEQRSRVLALG